MTQRRSAPRRVGRPTDRSGEETRQELLTAALALFSEHGYVGASVREIAENVGIRDSAIYGHFPSKRALYEEAMNAAEADILGAGASKLDEMGEEEPEGALRELARRLITAWSKPQARQFIGAMVRDGLQEGSTLFSDATDRLATPFEGWAEKGLIRVDVAPSDLARSFFTPLFLARLLYLQGEVTASQKKKAREIVKRHLDFFVATITPRGKRGRSPR